MTDQNLRDEFHVAVCAERGSGIRVLELIVLVEDRMIALKDGYPDTRAWLIGVHKYSDPAAYRRIGAARVLADVPCVRQKIESGEVNLTTMAQNG